MFSGASSSEQIMRYAPELVFGEVNVAGNHRALRYTGESLTFTLTKEASQEINNHRANVAKSIVDAEASGGISFDLSFKEYDELIEATLQGTWAVKDFVAAADLTFAPGSITASASEPGFANLKADSWFTVANAVENKNRLFRAKTVTDTVITLYTETPAVAETLVAAEVNLSVLSNGKVRRSFTIEKENADVNKFFHYKGMNASMMTLNLSAGAMTNGEFTFMGKYGDNTAASVMPGTEQPSYDYQVMTGVAGIACALWADKKPMADTIVSSLSLSYDNALRQQKGLCALGALGLGNGTISCTISAEIYFTNYALFEDMESNRNQEIAFTAFDVEGNGYVFVLPKANVSSYTVNAGGRDQDLLATVEFEALVYLKNDTDPSVIGKVLEIHRIAVQP